MSKLFFLRTIFTNRSSPKFSPTQFLKKLFSIISLTVKRWCRVMVLTWVVAEVSSPSHRLMNWAFIMAVASWS